MASPLKRKAASAASPKTKKAKVDIPAYHLAPSRRDSAGEIIWPARQSQINRARDIITECARARQTTLVLPDKDADGLSSGAILHHTLTSLGLPPNLISVHFPAKGTSIFDESTRDAISAKSPSYIFVLDQGSRKGPALLGTPHKCLIIDHHFAEEGGFPEGADYVTAHDCPPVATSSLLTYHICLPLYRNADDRLAWLAALGTHGDLGTTIKWQPPFPDMAATFKAHSKTSINSAVALVNAPRRSPAHNVAAAWNSVLWATTPASIVHSTDLERAAGEVKLETDRWARVPPKFSADATIAVLTISSPAQIHPVIATRWAGSLQSEKLEVIMCANEGYLDGMVNFSCRVARSARAKQGGEKVDIIKTLEAIVKDQPELRARLGDNCARGHKEASGGIVRREDWAEFKKLMGVGENTRKKAEGLKKDAKPAQKNTLANYFVKA